MGRKGSKGSKARWRGEARRCRCWFLSAHMVWGLEVIRHEWVFYLLCLRAPFCRFDTSSVILCFVVVIFLFLTLALPILHLCSYFLLSAILHSFFPILFCCSHFCFYTLDAHMSMWYRWMECVVFFLILTMVIPLAYFCITLPSALWSSLSFEISFNFLQTTMQRISCRTSPYSREEKNAVDWCQAFRNKAHHDCLSLWRSWTGVTLSTFRGVFVIGRCLSIQQPLSVSVFWIANLLRKGIEDCWVVQSITRTRSALQKPGVSNILRSGEPPIIAIIN